MPAFLPPFPDPHTYIRTEVGGDVDSNYEKVRRVTAENRRDVENSLENFALAIHPSISVFQDLEKTLYAEAKQVIEQQKLERKQRLEAIKAAKKAKKDSMNIGTEGSDAALNNSASEEESLEILDVEDLLELEETEKSYVRKRIPAYCQILLPFEEDHPYLSALVTDDNLDDDQNHFARILSQEMEDDLNDELMDSSNSMNGGDMD
uniref:Transcription initiation factor TFIID subunit 8 n=1 Tax=Ditylenchus dipsaci TaxID=166011 RepID=A0A915DIA3_9BILA